MSQVSNSSNNSAVLSRQSNYVDFDPANKIHRAIFLEFRIHGKWPSSMRFKLDPLYPNVPTMINQRLLEFYFKRDRSIPIDIRSNIKEDGWYAVGLVHEEN